ncbi:PAS domain-containing sensor histidine kinase [Comamonas serinivorans]|uniref:histidine kinase n=1 Tax=Comamonas serinivorans TaxID=1082851 RepID=A0A1Y0ETC9_9BURK|nr:PAS domain-containing sensor histidine kinase [Comamonas serinivorans]
MADTARFQAFDRLASLVAVVRHDGQFAFVNVALESVLGRPLHSLRQLSLQHYLQDTLDFEQALAGVRRNAFSHMRFDATLVHPELVEPMLVHVMLAQPEDPDEIVIEMVPIDLQVRLAREERQAGFGEANKELVRNLAHEIKNPLGGIRGAAQLLEMDIEDKGLREYTQVIIHEADRLQTLVDRLLAPHRHAHVVGAVNIHEVCERVRSLILAEFPQGLTIARDYDISLPDLHADRQQLIQAVLNIAHNAAQALSERIQAGDARITLRTRVARQVTIGKRRHKLALQLLIQDNGPGVPDAIKERVFFPLVSGRDGGTGLGLTLAQTFVQQHDGMIEVDSEPGRTEFHILIPLPS